MKCLPLAILLLTSSAFACPSFDGSQFVCEGDDGDLVQALKSVGGSLISAGDTITLNGAPNVIDGRTISGTCSADTIRLTETISGHSATIELRVQPNSLELKGQSLVVVCYDADEQHNCKPGARQELQVEDVDIRCRRK